MEFRNRFVAFAVEYFENENLEEKEYRWLLENVDEVNAILGGSATMTYKPPFANYIVKNYELLINLLPEFNSSMGAHRDNATTAESILTRYIGSMKKLIQKRQKKLRQPMHGSITLFVRCSNSRFGMKLCSVKHRQAYVGLLDQKTDFCAAQNDTLCSISF